MILLSDIGRFIRQHPKQTVLRELSMFHIARVFVAKHVPGEVEEYLEN